MKTTTFNPDKFERRMLASMKRLDRMAIKLEAFKKLVNKVSYNMLNAE